MIAYYYYTRIKTETVPNDRENNNPFKYISREKEIKEIITMAEKEMIIFYLLVVHVGDGHFFNVE